MKELRGRTVLITGAASGIGRCLALEFRGKGSNLALADIDEGGLERVAQEIRSGGGTVTVHGLDVTDHEQVEALAGEVHPDVLVNCAGVLVFSRIEDTARGDWERVLRVNVWGIINMVAAFLPGMRERGGHIVNIASGVGLYTLPFAGPYVTSKFAVVGYTETLIAELSGSGVRVTMVIPGLVNTPLYDLADGTTVEKRLLDKVLKVMKPLFFTTPEKLSAAAVTAVAKDRQVLVHTFPNRFLYFIKRLSPALYRMLAAASYRLMQWFRSRG